MLLQPAHIGFAAQEPEQFVDDGLQVQLLGREQRKTLAEIEAHLVPEYRQGAGAGAVALFDSFVEDALQKLLVLSH